MHPLDTIGYRLSNAHHRVNHALAALLRAHCLERGKAYVITPPQWGLMAVLDTTTGQPIGVLAQKLAIDAAALTGTVKRLEQSGLIERVHDQQDRRIVNISLTTEGQDIVNSLDPVVAAFDEQIFPREQQQAFFAQLNQILSRVSLLVPEAESHFDFAIESLRQQEHEQEDK